MRQRSTWVAKSQNVGQIDVKAVAIKRRIAHAPLLYGHVTGRRVSVDRAKYTAAVHSCW